jgi:threonine/homoserine/homoserine lactone efflux protein
MVVSILCMLAGITLLGAAINPYSFILGICGGVLLVWFFSKTGRTIGEILKGKKES